MVDKKVTSPTAGELSRIDSPAPRRRWVRVVASLAIGLIVTSCLSCALVAWLVRPRLYEDPAVARAVAANMLTFTPSPGFEPRGTIEWNLLSFLTLRGVYYEHRSADGVLMLLEVANPRLEGFSDVRKHVEHVLREKNGVGDALIVDQKVERLTLNVQGRDREFAISSARDPVTDASYKLLEGTVEGPGGPILIGMRVASAAWNLDAVRDMLMSIK